MARRGENIYHRKDGRWEGRYIIGRKMDGKPKFHSIYGHNYSEVKRKLVILKGNYLQSNESMPILIYKNGTLSEWMDYWLEVLERPHIKMTTYQLYVRNINKHLRPMLGCCLLKEMKSEDIQAAVDQLKDSLAPNTLHGLCRQLRSIINSAVKNGLMIKSPYEGIRLPKFIQRKPRVLTTKEQVKLEESAIKEGNLEYLLDLYTGLRLGELCALRYRDIDFETNTLLVSHSVKRISKDGKSYLIVGDTKTECSMRIIPLPLFLIQMLKQRKEDIQAKDDDFIFSNSKGEAGEPRTLQTRLERLMKTLGIHGVHFHTLRHTFAMRCLEKGMGYKALSELLGHSSSQITINHYDNCTMESKIKIMEAAHLMA